MFLARFVAPALLAVVLAPPPGAEQLGADKIPCPDGSVVVREAYDPDPSNPRAVIIIYKRGEKPIALLDSVAMTLTLADGEVITLDRVGRRWQTPCELPLGV
jgi:hypothetical protein